MANSIYQINKGVNKPVEFKGLEAQYIWYLGSGITGTLVLFAILYICGVNAFVCVIVALGIGAFVFYYVFKLSKTFGEHGLMKKRASRHVPKLIKSKSRKIWKSGLKK